jgi:hypothetical protein
MVLRNPRRGRRGFNNWSLNLMLIYGFALHDLVDWSLKGINNLNWLLTGRLTSGIVNWLASTSNLRELTHARGSSCDDLVEEALDTRYD